MEITGSKSCLENGQQQVELVTDENSSLKVKVGEFEVRVVDKIFEMEGLTKKFEECSQTSRS